MTSDAKEGRVKAMTPHAAPTKKDTTVRSTSENDNPTPTVVRISEEIAMVLVEGKPTRLARL